MPELDGILETALYTDDMERARAFYEGTLGLKPMFGDNRLTAYGVASAADLKFLHHLQQIRLGTSNRNAALES
jgi:catechol 2,3-dioxygenase-like lactoylglutathione lyase family enzyme